jgi:K+-sensing histidine kinase KdpD
LQPQDTVDDVIASMQSEVGDHHIAVIGDQKLPLLAFDQRLVRLVVKQLFDNALKFATGKAGGDRDVCPTGVRHYGDHGFPARHRRG